jgi:multicomponent Na+:H+ antiporter subunit C
MEIFWSVVIGFLFFASVYLMLRRSLAKILLGFLLISHAANILIFTSGGLLHGKAPFIKDTVANLSEISDPLAQSLILTAIVIGFSVISFCIALYANFYATNPSDDVDKLIEEGDV